MTKKYKIFAVHLSLSASANIIQNVFSENNTINVKKKHFY